MHSSLKITLLLLLSSVHFCFAQQLQWNKVASGIWLAKAGNPDSVNFLTTSGAKPKIPPSTQWLMCPFLYPKEKFPIRWWMVKHTCAFPWIKLEKIFGLGLNFKTVEQRGRIMRLHVDHYGGRDDGALMLLYPFMFRQKGTVCSSTHRHTLTFG